MWHQVTSCDIMWSRETWCGIMWHCVTLCSFMCHHVPLCDIVFFLSMNMVGRLSKPTTCIVVFLPPRSKFWQFVNIAVENTLVVHSKLMFTLESFGNLGNEQKWRILKTLFEDVYTWQKNGDIKRPWVQVKLSF